MQTDGNFLQPVEILKKSERPVDALALKKNELVTDLQFQIKRC